MSDFSVFKGNFKNILVTRTDRLGDVMLATPVLAKIREIYPEAKLFFLVQKMWMPVLQLPGVELIEYSSTQTVEELAEIFRERKIDAAIVLRDEKVISQAVKRAAIAVRVGPYSTFRSFFCFNRGKIQKRSRCKMHEAEYNLDLLTQIGIPFSGPAQSVADLPRSWVKTAQVSADKMQTWLTEQGIEKKKYICFHPGSSGSARYLSTEVMEQVVHSFFMRGHTIILTGGAHEGQLLKDLIQNQERWKAEGPGAGSSPAIKQGRVLLFEGGGLDELAELYRNASAVVAHGTGPLHLAAAVKTPVYAIFSPLSVLSEKRWGPLTADRFVWTPSVPCPEKYKCQGARCLYFDCMSQFDILSLNKKIDELGATRHSNNESKS